MINPNSKTFCSMKYDCTAKDFQSAIKEIIDENDLWIATLTIDNGGENALLGTIVDKLKIFNCLIYCSATMEPQKMFIEHQEG